MIIHENFFSTLASNSKDKLISVNSQLFEKEEKIE
jgi:hypothetical protein